MNKTIVIFHNHCTDGTGAAWAAHCYFRQVGNNNVTYHAWNYKDPMPSVDLTRDADVYIVDFSFKQDIILEMATTAKSVTVLDHHKTAADDLANVQYPANVKVVFDMKRSGAGITWDYFFPNQARPKLIDYIEDGDLYRHSLVDVYPLLAVIHGTKKTFSDYDELDKKLKSNYAQVLERGMIHQEIQTSFVESLAKRYSVKEIECCGEKYKVAIQNNGMLISSVLNAILTNNQELDFAVSYVDEDFQVRRWSVRSRPAKDPGKKMSIIPFVQQYGGGGHESAAGFCSSTSFMV